MASNDANPMLAALRGLEESLDEHMRTHIAPSKDAVKPRRRVYDFGFFAWVLRAVNESPCLQPLRCLRHLRRLGILGPHLRRAGLVIAGVLCIGAIGFGILWWRLSS